jgi:hypothetical protein
VSGEAPPTTADLLREVAALREAVAELAVAQAEGLNALAELARLVEAQYGGLFLHQRPEASARMHPEAYARMAASLVHRRAATAAGRSLEVAGRFLPEEPSPDDG